MLLGQREFYQEFFLGSHLKEGMFKGVYAVYECLHQRDIRDLLLLVPSHPTSRGSVHGALLGKARVQR